MPTEELFPVDSRQVAVTLSRFSRLRNQPIYKQNDQLFFGVYNRPILSAMPSDSFHTVVEGENLRLDLLAYFYYRSPELWWVIAVANNIVSPFDEIEIGRVLRIPNPSTLLAGRT